MILKRIIYSVIIISKVLADGGYDIGTSAGKNNFDFSFTLNPNNYFKQGQSYLTFGYGISEKIDIHGYYSRDKENSNYYGGIFFQFLDTKYVDLATAIGIRRFSNNSNIHLFSPQLLYTIYLSPTVNLGGSIVNITKYDFEIHKQAIDIFLSKKLYRNKTVDVSFSLGIFKPAFWVPDKWDWHPTYSIDIKIK